MLGMQWHTSQNALTQVMLEFSSLKWKLLEVSKKEALECMITYSYESYQFII